VNRPHFVDHPVPGENGNKHPMPSGSPALNHSPKPNGNQPAPPTRQMKQPQAPDTAPHVTPGRNEFSAPNQTQHPSPPANYNSAPPSAPTAPNKNNSYSPRGWEQTRPLPSPRPNSYNPVIPAATPSPRQGQSSAPEAGHRNVPAAAPLNSHSTTNRHRRRRRRRKDRRTRIRIKMVLATAPAMVMVTTRVINFSFA